MDAPSELECKLLFAKLLHKSNGNSFEAMTHLCAYYGWSDPTFQSTYSGMWAVDPIVEDEVKRLSNVVKTREEHLSDIAKARAIALQAGDYRAVATMDKNYADIAGFIQKVTGSDKSEGTEDSFDDSSIPPLEPEETLVESVESDG